MNHYVGEPKITSLSVQTEDAGEIIGLGIVFESALSADQFLRHMHEYFDSPRASSRSFVVYFYDRGSYCNLAIDVRTRLSSLSIEISRADHQVLDDLVAALNDRPYFFIIACLQKEGVTVPYDANSSVIFQSRLLIDGRTVSGKRDGAWTQEDLFI
jgi:hypothetical protein